MSLKSTNHQLHKEWYGKLKDEGFVDVEDGCLKHPTLREFHCLKYTKDQMLELRFKSEAYQTRAERFLNHEAFYDAAISITQHGNCKVIVEEIKYIWLMHCNGHTERTIAKETGRSKTCIHKTLEKLRDWMNVV